jgi:hypothetical protein
MASILSTVGEVPTWHVQRTVAGTDMNGDEPGVATPGDTTPAISAGLALWDGLANAGTFDLGATGYAVVVEQLYLNYGSGSGTTVIVGPLGSTRPTPSAPFKLGPGEMIQFTTSGVGGGNKAEAGVLLRLDYPWIGT